MPLGTVSSSKGFLSRKVGILVYSVGEPARYYVDRCVDWSCWRIPTDYDHAIFWK